MRIHGFLLFFCLILTVSCQSRMQSVKIDDLDSILVRGELNVATLYGTTTYFQFDNQEMGLEYMSVKRFADSHRLKLNVFVAPDFDRMLHWVHDGACDIALYGITQSSITRTPVLLCGPASSSHPVLVQRKYKDTPPLKEISELTGKEIYINSGSQYTQLLKRLNRNFENKIQIRYFENDNITLEEQIDKVACGEISYTIADSYLADILKKFYHNIDTHLAIAEEEETAWAVNTLAPNLANALDEWAKKHPQTKYSEISKRFFEYSRDIEPHTILSPEHGILSEYDRHFKRYARQIGWDWRMLASQAYNESRFDTLATSSIGAQGLMQLMPRTAASVGADTTRLSNPEVNIAAAVRYIRTLDKSFASIPDQKERAKFILAAYNGGSGHIHDAMALARKYDKDPYVWENNVKEMLRLKNDPTYYNDEVCRHGNFKAWQTIAYVDEVLRIYRIYQAVIPR